MQTPQDIHVNMSVAHLLLIWLSKNAGHIRLFELIAKRFLRYVDTWFKKPFISIQAIVLCKCAGDMTGLQH